MSASPTVDVVVVGAGIAGLTAAIALGRSGVGVRVVERATALTQAGTALSLWPNALAALDRIGLRDAVASIGVPEPEGVIRQPSGKLIARLDQSRLHRRHGTQTLIVHRADLQHVLLDAVSPRALRMNTAATSVRTEGEVGIVELATGETLRAPVVLACDGIRSVARSVVDNPPIAYRRRTSWRAVIEGASHLVGEASLTVGQGRQFIASPLRGGVYWAADAALPEGANAALTDKKGFLRDTFAGWHDPISELIDCANEEQLVIADFYDSIPRTLASGRIAVLGDAAHPMTPDLGQGACQGIEDAVVIAACLAQIDDPTLALADYQSTRLARVRSIVRGSRRIGVLATSKSPIACAVRNAALRHVPTSINSRMVARYASERAFDRTLPPHSHV